MSDPSITTLRTSLPIRLRSALAGGAWQVQRAAVWPARVVRRWQAEHIEALELRSASHSERRDLQAIGMTLPFDLPHPRRPMLAVLLPAHGLVRLWRMRSRERSALFRAPRSVVRELNARGMDAGHEAAKPFWLP